jgi:hypothetical protein
MKRSSDIVCNKLFRQSDRIIEESRQDAGRMASCTFGNLILISVLTQYIAILPISAETQPIVFLLIVIFTMGTFFKGIVNWYSHPLFILIMAIIANGFVASYEFGTSSYVTLLKSILPLLFLIAAEHRSIRPNYKMYLCFIIIHSLLAIFYVIGYGDIFTQFFNRAAALGEQESRGFSFLSPEPSYAASYLFSLIVVEKTFFLDRRFSRLRQLALLILVAITKSALGLGFIFIGVLMFFGKKSLILLPTIFVILIVIWGEHSRLYDLINLASQLSLEDSIQTIAFLEPSGSTRLLINIMAIKEGLLSFFGYGIGSFEVSFIQTIQGFVLEIFTKHEILSASIRNGGAKPSSYLASITFELGIIALLYVFYFYKIQRAQLRSVGNKVIFWMIFLIFNIFQGQITSPTMPYILMLLLVGNQYVPVYQNKYEKNIATVNKS